jgi:hypothetical protein
VRTETGRTDRQAGSSSNRSRSGDVGPGETRHRGQADRERHQQRLAPAHRLIGEARRTEQPQQLAETAIHEVREGVDGDIGKAQHGRGRVQPHHPAADAEIERDAGGRHHHDDHIHQPVQGDIDAAPARLTQGGTRSRQGDGPDPAQGVAIAQTAQREIDDVGREAEEQSQARNHVDGPDLALRQVPFQEPGHTRARIVGRDAEPGDEARHHGDRGHPMNDDRAEIRPGDRLARCDPAPAAVQTARIDTLRWSRYACL